MLVAKSGFSCGVSGSFFLITKTTHSMLKCANTRGSKVDHANMLRKRDIENDVVQLRGDDPFGELFLENAKEVGAED